MSGSATAPSGTRHARGVVTAQQLDAALGLTRTHPGGLSVLRLITGATGLVFGACVTAVLLATWQGLRAAGFYPSGLVLALGGLSLMLSALLLVTLHWLVTRQVARPLEQLHHSARGLLDGSTARETIPISGAKELIGLAQTLRAVAGILERDKAALAAQVQELTARTLELQQARADVARAEHLASLGRLAAGVAHEIGNPLTAILGLVEVLQQDHTKAPADEDARDHADFLRRIHDETQRIHRIVSELLVYARTGNAAAMTLEPIRLSDVIVQARGLLPNAPPMDISIPDDVCVSASQDALLQILLNVMGNAGAAMRMAGAKGVISIGCTVEARNVSIVVEDDGPGIASEHLEKIFEPFFTTKPVGQGTGLGLSVCQALAHAMHGQLIALPNASRGGRLQLTLPRA